MICSFDSSFASLPDFYFFVLAVYGPDGIFAGSTAMFKKPACTVVFDLVNYSTCARIVSTNYGSRSDFFNDAAAFGG